jgi:hypothetical protein
MVHPCSSPDSLEAVILGCQRLPGSNSGSLRQYLDFHLPHDESHPLLGKEVGAESWSSLRCIDLQRDVYMLAGYLGIAEHVSCAWVIVQPWL